MSELPPEGNDDLLRQQQPSQDNAAPTKSTSIQSPQPQSDTQGRKKRKPNFAPISDDPETKKKVRRIIEQQFNLEIYMKQREIHQLESSIQKTQIMLDVVQSSILNKHNGITPNNSGLLSIALSGKDKRFGGLSRNTFSNLLSSSSNISTPPPVRQSARNVNYSEFYDNSTSTRGYRRDRLSTINSSSGCLYAQTQDEKFIRITCPGCGRTNFATFQGFINHCRIVHEMEFTSHAEAANICGVLVENDQAEIPANHPVRRMAPLAAPFSSISSGAVAAGTSSNSNMRLGMSLLESQLSEQQRSEIRDTLEKLNQPKIKVYEEDVDFDEEGDEEDEYNNGDSRVHAGKGISNRSQPKPQKNNQNDPTTTSTPGATTPIIDQQQQNKNSDIPLFLTQHMAYAQPPPRESRFHVIKQIIIGNVSKYVAVDKRLPQFASHTHKWTFTVRTPAGEQPPGTFIRKVRYFLHPSYRPNDIVDIMDPFEFELSRMGWGEFPIRLQLFFVDKRNKPVDLVTVIELDKFQSGRTVMGSQKIIDIELDRLSKFRSVDELGGADVTQEDKKKADSNADSDGSSRGKSIARAVLKTCQDSSTSENNKHLSTSMQVGADFVDRVGPNRYNSAVTVSSVIDCKDQENKSDDKIQSKETPVVNRTVNTKITQQQVAPLQPLPKKPRDPIHPVLGILMGFACRAFPICLDAFTPIKLLLDNSNNSESCVLPQDDYFDGPIFTALDKQSPLPKLLHPLLLFLSQPIPPRPNNQHDTQNYQYTVFSSTETWKEKSPLGKRLSSEYQRAALIHKHLVSAILGKRGIPQRKKSVFLRNRRYRQSKTPTPEPIVKKENDKTSTATNSVQNQTSYNKENKPNSQETTLSRFSGMKEPPPQSTASSSAGGSQPGGRKIVLDKRRAIECFTTFLELVGVDNQEHIKAIKECVQIIDGQSMVQIFQTINKLQKNGPKAVKIWLRQYHFTPHPKSIEHEECNDYGDTDVEEMRVESVTTGSVINSNGDDKQTTLSIKDTTSKLNDDLSEIALAKPSPSTTQPQIITDNNSGKQEIADNKVAYPKSESVKTAVVGDNCQSQIPLNDSTNKPVDKQQTLALIKQESKTSLSSSSDQQFDKTNADKGNDEGVTAIQIQQQPTTMTIRKYCMTCGNLFFGNDNDDTMTTKDYCSSICRSVWCGDSKLNSHNSTLSRLSELVKRLPKGWDHLDDDGNEDLDIDEDFQAGSVTASSKSISSIIDGKDSGNQGCLSLFEKITSQIRQQAMTMAHDQQQQPYHRNITDPDENKQIVKSKPTRMLMTMKLIDWVWVDVIRPLELFTTPAARLSQYQTNKDPDVEDNTNGLSRLSKGTSTRPSSSLLPKYHHGLADANSKALGLSSLSSVVEIDSGKSMVSLVNADRKSLEEAIDQRVVVGKLMTDIAKLFLRDLVNESANQIRKQKSVDCQELGKSSIDNNNSKATMAEKDVDKPQPSPSNQKESGHGDVQANSPKLSVALSEIGLTTTATTTKNTDHQNISDAIVNINLPKVMLTPWHVLRAVQKRSDLFDMCSNVYLGTTD
ncbi:hypothetical protein H4219_003923 [Mycoemilia scoparia]|uniref:YEATS domain-containing protein n=1 Tax=Mycoemilia scoparia TaxID=417184 RepID=A0A9W7ZTC2_9FUNG|nr:hypothetical protein H4219_003923 [Mycoemilia scoparia]